MKFVKTALILAILLACNLALSAAIPAAERQALIDLYNSTNGASWTNKANWLGAAGTENTWFGVTTDAGNTTVLQLNLQGNNLTGPIPSSLGDLSNLQWLNLGYNHPSTDNNGLTGSIPSSLGNLSNLQRLSLGYNQLTGSIPPELGNLSNLQQLSLNRNALTGSIPSSLGNLSNLQLLFLAENPLTGSIPPELGNLSNLELLKLFSNQLTGSIPSSLGNLSKLIYLQLNSNQLTGSIPSSLGNLSKLDYLSLHSNQLTGSIPTELGNLSKLVTLYLYSNQLTGSIPTSLTNLTSLNSSNTDIGFNAFHTSDAGLISFLNSKDSNWAATQTIAPTNISAVPGSASVNVSWTSITFTGYTGGYRIFYATVAGGPYTFYAQTANKSASSQLVSGLTPGIPYYFVVQTRTDAHANNLNVVTSENSDEVSATPPGIPATITATSPNGGESWVVGSTHNITWTTTGAIANVKIEYSTNGGTAWSTVIASTSNTGTFPWTVPNTPSTQCLVQVSEALTGTPADMSNAVFSIASSSSVAISGTVTAGGTALPNVAMNGLPGNPVTNASGQYTGTVDYNWTGIVTPSKTGYTFSPTNRAYSNITSSQSSQDYSGSSIITYTVSGYVQTTGVAGISGVVMSGLPNSPQTDANGYYSDSVNSGWSGTVTPSKAGYTFSPTSRTYSNVISNQSSQNYTGSAAVPTVKADFNGDGQEDILWRNMATGENYLWYMGQSMSGMQDAVTKESRNMSMDFAPARVIEVTGDIFKGEPPSISWDPRGGEIQTKAASISAGRFGELGPKTTVEIYKTPYEGIATILGLTRIGSAPVLTLADLNWQIVGTGDFNGDGKPDILWRNYVTGENGIWYMNAEIRIGANYLATVADTNWQIVGTGDYNRDGRLDILWRNNVTDENYYWYLNGLTKIGGDTPPSIKDLTWKIMGTADFNGDGRPDILWRNSVTGENGVWYMNEGYQLGADYLVTVTDLNWQIAGTGDFNGDGKPDILWRNSVTGENYIWYMNGVIRIGGEYLIPVTDLNWKIVNR
jgi:hypothetical protein